MRNLLTLLALLPAMLFAQSYRVETAGSAVNVSVGADGVRWSVSVDGREVMSPSPLSLTIAPEAKPAQRTVLAGPGAKVKRARQWTEQVSLKPHFYKRSEIKTQCNVLQLSFAGGYDVEFRAYPGVVAYRFVTHYKQPQRVYAERADFRFPAGAGAYVPYLNDPRGGERYCTSFESYYDEQPVSELFADSLIHTPMLLSLDGGLKVAVSDFAVEDYPGMYLVSGETSAADGVATLSGVWAPVVLDTHVNVFNEIPDVRADYLATGVSGERSYPWRAVVIARNDAELLDCDAVQLLSSPCRIGDVSWVRPGKVAWDWWNDLQLRGVDFVAGINTDTYKYYIDFAAENGLEYVILDEGWSDTADLMDVRPAVDLETLVSYGRERGVRLILWATWRAMRKDLERVMTHYAAMGIAGFKIDFFDRDDQDVVRDMYAFAATAAREHLVLDYHGMKCGGLHVPYPNVLNFEGVKGLENLKWAEMTDRGPAVDFPRYDLTAPFIRQLAGPMDYTPGAMRNGTRYTFRANHCFPMSVSTRSHQLAMYVAYEAPLQMLCDNPIAYRSEQESTDFIAAVPTVFDETRVLAAEVGEYLIIARRSGSTWFVGAMTDYDGRDAEVDFSFLGADGSAGADAWRATIFSDGLNADRDAADYKRSVVDVTPATRMKIHMAGAGGWAARIEKK